MATWIVHLRIAENLLERIPGLDTRMFAVGNIAPDSGLPDEKWEKFSPPTEVTHFRKEASQFECADLEFYRGWLSGLSWPGSDPERYSFLLGYYCHLVTDNLWTLRIGKPTLQRFKDLFDADRNFIWEVKKDWYGLDFVYVRTHPDSLYWRLFSECEYPVNYASFLLQEGVQQRIEYIKTWYQSTSPEIEEIVSRERLYLTEADADTFVDEATGLLDKAHRRLRTGRVPSENQDTILEWALNDPGL
jgi:hypothetical protein